MGKRLICQDSALEPVLNPSSYYGTWICGAFATFFKAQKIPPEATKNDWWKACVKAAHLIAVLKLVNCCILQDSSFLINEPTRPLYSYAHNGTIGSFEIVGVEMNFKSFALFWGGRGWWMLLWVHFYFTAFSFWLLLHFDSWLFGISLLEQTNKTIDCLTHF